MDFISINFYVFLCAVVCIYYIFPRKARWVVLLCGSLLFYYLASGATIWIFLGMIALSYACALLNEKLQTGTRKWIRRAVLAGSLLVTAAPLTISKGRELFVASFLHQNADNWIIPLGLSFFTLQMLAYLVDVYQGKCKAQRNPFKYALFVSFFPQILQGPIPRYEQLQEQLCEGHAFDEKEFSKGLQLIIWGFFLKLMIADKAAVIVDTVFANYSMYRGCYILVAGILYSIQLYADFLACVSIAKGVAELFGVKLADNFRHPYMATSIKDFWGRWHISLSSWLRDYIYIPLGGSRKGKIRKYFNLAVTFLMSGFWHGAGIRYIFWGCMHATYYIAGDVTKKYKDRIYTLLGMPEGCAARRWIQRIGTFFWVMLAWIIFRARSLKEGIVIIDCMFRTYNPWIFFDDSLFKLGLEWKECFVLAASILLLMKVSMMQEKMCIRDKILQQPLLIRWILYIATIIVIYVFGTYGFGFNAQDFIYGGF